MNSSEGERSLFDGVLGQAVFKWSVWIVVVSGGAILEATLGREVLSCGSPVMSRRRVRTGGIGMGSCYEDS